MNENILIIEDDEAIREMVTECLESEGYNVLIACDGMQAIDILTDQVNNLDLVLLDLLLPHIDGLEVLRRMRNKSQIPVLIMSAKGSDVDKALGLGLGADDYIAKPFSIIELVARVKAMIRRAEIYSGKTILAEDNRQNIIERGNMCIDLDRFIVTIDEKNIQLTYKEFKILKLLAQNPTRVYTKAQIYKAVWEEEYFKDENVINVHIRRLREKIEENPSKPRYVTTVWGIGYRFGDQL